MNDNPLLVHDDLLQRIRDTPEERRTGQDRAILGIDTALHVAWDAMEAAGFKLDHLILLFDADETPDRNPEAAQVGMVMLPEHPECAVPLLAGAMGSLVGGQVNLSVSDDEGEQDGPIHRQ